MTHRNVYRRLPGALLVGLLLSIAYGAAARQPYTLRLAVESAFVRAAPSLESSIVASAFAQDSLTAIGRNADGTWFQIERPAGWISRTVVVITFDLAALPLTDGVTGIEGSTPVIDTGFTLQTIDDAPLYANPDRRAAVLADLVPFVLVPVIDRTPDNQWLQVNYRGRLGWLPQHLTRASAALADIPINPRFAADARYPAAVIVPDEVQLAQADRLLAFVAPLDPLAYGVASYWDSLRGGEVVDCLRIPADIPYYSLSEADIAELPELRQATRSLNDAVDDLNAALEPTNVCGILIGVDLGAAYASAINARAIFRLVRERMEDARARILDDDTTPVAPDAIREVLAVIAEARHHLGVIRFVYGGLAAR